MIARLNKYWHVWVHASAIAQHSLTGLYMAASVYHIISKELENNSFQHNHIFRQTSTVFPLISTGPQISGAH